MITISDCGEVEKIDQIQPNATATSTTTTAGLSSSQAATAVASSSPSAFSSASAPMAPSYTEITGRHRSILMDFYRKHDTRKLYSVDQQLAEVREQAKKNGLLLVDSGPLEELSKQLKERYGTVPCWD